MTKDAADLHVERWRGHWVLEQEFDDDVEAMTVRLANINRYFKTHHEGGRSPRWACRTSSTTPCTT